MLEHLGDTGRFLKAFFEDPIGVSSVVRTSTYASKLVCEKMDTLKKKRNVIVEYGPGTGPIINHLLENDLLGPEDIVILIERNPTLAQALKKRITHPNVHVVQGSAENVEQYLEEILDEDEEKLADYVLMSIPLSTDQMEDTRIPILQASKRILRPGPDSKCIVFLFRKIVREYIKEVFQNGKPDEEQWYIHEDIAFWNFPSLRLFEITRQAIQKDIGKWRRLLVRIFKYLP